MYEEKIEKARQVVEAHNSSTDSAVDFEAFLGKLRAEGGTSEAALASCSWDDLQSMGLPKLLARQVAEIFRKNEEARPKPISTHRAMQMTAEELLASYDHRDPKNAVGSRLSELSNGKRFIVFNDDMSVNAEASATLLSEIRDSYPEREYYPVEGRPRRTYKVGDRPGQLADENPLYPGRMLRPDGTCDQTNRSWNDVPFEVRCLLYLAVHDTGELIIDRIDSAHNAMDLALKENAEPLIRSRYSKASVRFDELKDQGKLPTLKVSRSPGQSTTNNPFLSQGHHRQH